MGIRVGTAVVAAAAVGAGVWILVAAGGSSAPHRSRERAVAAAPQALPPLAPGMRAVRVGCSTRSEAEFPGAFTRSANVRVGPLVLVAGAFTSAATVREFGGNKFPLLVEAGHTVTLEVGRRARRRTALAYGPLPQRRQTRVRDGYQRVTFVACRPGRTPRDYRPDGPSSSRADGRPVTFWAGGVVTRRAGCVPLTVYVDAERSPRHVGLSLGRRCPR
jgi:hypothetical protein